MITSTQVAQKTSVTKIVSTISHCILALLITTHAHAQNSSSNEISLNGLAAYAKLRKEYYIGGLYLETGGLDSVNFAGKKRMEMRISAEKWAPRRSSSDWSEAIVLNNEQALLLEFADQIQAFTDLPKDDLIAGDRITVDMGPAQGTTVYLNGAMAFNVSSSAFFDVLLNVWVGKRPPSSDFKNHILTLPTNQASKDLLVRFHGTKPSDVRRKEIAGWFKSKPTRVATTTSKPAPLATADKVKRVAVAHTVKSVTEAPIVAAEKTPPAVQPIIMPKVEIEKPQIATMAFSAVAEHAKLAQKKLKRDYNSNILKLTYLNLIYPEKAIKRKQTGKVALKVKLNRMGEVVTVTEELRSRYSRLNKAAIKAIEKAAPYPEPPKELLGDAFEFTLPFHFKL